MSEDIVKESIKCLANMEIKETTYQVARSVVLDEIERLNNLLKETSQTLSEQTTKAITLKSENERLNKELKSLQDSYDIEEEQANYHINLTDDLREEVDRLNNIINELEKWLVERIDEYKEMGLYDNADMYEYTLYTLQELKGSDKE